MEDKLKNQIKLEFLSVPENVALARVVVASLASQIEMTLNDLEEIKVATSEAVSNSIIHGYKNKAIGLVSIIGTIYDEKLEIEIFDKGVGIQNVQEAMQPTFSSDPERMGLGFVFMQSFMDDLIVESEIGKGTRVVLIKDITKYKANQPLAI